MSRFWPNAHALVTGAGSGIGAATAIALAKAGVRVSIAGSRIDALKATAALLGEHAGVAVSIDATDEAAVTKGVAQIEAEAGPIDILVNNAGKAASAPFDKTSAALWADMLASNLSSVFLVTHAVLPGMAQRGRGRVINVASTAGLTGYAYVSAYVAAKHGVVGVDESFYDRAMAHQRQSFFVVGGKNYGQGSSREHAAMAPRYLGLMVVIAKSFARIHRQNLVNFGILPLTFVDNDAYGHIRQGDVLEIEHAVESLRRGNPVAVRNATRNNSFLTEHGLSERQITAVMEGGLINMVRKRQAFRSET